MREKLMWMLLRIAMAWYVLLLVVLVFLSVASCQRRRPLVPPVLSPSWQNDRRFSTADVAQDLNDPEVKRKMARDYVREAFFSRK